MSVDLPILGLNLKELGKILSLRDLSKIVVVKNECSYNEIMSNEIKFETEGSILNEFSNKMNNENIKIVIYPVKDETESFTIKFSIKNISCVHELWYLYNVNQSLIKDIKKFYPEILFSDEYY